MGDVGDGDVGDGDVGDDDEDPITYAHHYHYQLIFLQL